MFCRIQIALTCLPRWYSRDVCSTMMIKSLKLVMMLVVSGALGCQDLPVVTLKNALRESTCKLSENQTEVDTFREHVFTKHGALTSKFIQNLTCCLINDY